MPPSDFAAAMAQAQGPLNAAFGATITYARAGESDLTGLTARFSSERDEVSLAASDIDFGAGAVAPARGDTITDADGNAYCYPGPESVEVDGVRVELSTQYLPNTARYRIPIRLRGS